MRKVKIRREIHCTTAPVTKASATLTKMAMMTDNALLELRRSDISRLPSVDILRSAKTNVPPKSSIIPADSRAPAMIPTEATMRTVRNRATLAPMAEFIKLTASLLTPTNKSTTASTSRNTIIIR